MRPAEKQRKRKAKPGIVRKKKRAIREALNVHGKPHSPGMKMDTSGKRKCTHDMRKG